MMSRMDEATGGRECSRRGRHVSILQRKDLYTNITSHLIPSRGSIGLERVR